MKSPAAFSGGGDDCRFKFNAYEKTLKPRTAGISHDQQIGSARASVAVRSAQQPTWWLQMRSQCVF